MAGSEQQSSDQFSLVSLENSQKAASSYSSMSRRARGESESTLSINEDEEKEKAAAPKPPPPPKKKEPAGNTGGKSGQKKSPSKPPPVDGDRLDQSIDDVLARLEEFNQLVSTLVGNISQASRNLFLVIVTPLIPLLNGLLKLLNGPIQFINLLARKVNDKMGNKRGGSASNSQRNSAGNSDVDADGAPMEEEADAPPPPDINAKHANYSDMLELNIVFTDNMKKPLYKKKPNAPSTRMGAMEEDLIMSNAILAINECAEFTLELPNPTTGLYAGQRIYDIMANVTKEDVAIFLGFVKAFPGKYIGKEWKISETFATWLINNAPISE
jgi:hypothetical protein